MSHAIKLERDPKKNDEAAVTAIARETDASIDVVTQLYSSEIASLNETARIRQFVSVIAIKRVKQKLRAVSGPH
jgi:predicted HTH domain antitoxin